MKYNLATSKYDCQRLGGTNLKMGSLSILFGWSNSSKDDIVKSFFQVVAHDPRRVLEVIPLNVDYFDLFEWTREAIIVYVLTHHADVLNRYGIEYDIGAEAVALPENFMGAE
jgi:hypothetical protein